MCLCRTWCFVLHSVVDFQKGERYVEDQRCHRSLLILHKADNMDYSICNALAYHTEPMNSALIIYDVACQWSYNLLMLQTVTS